MAMEMKKEDLAMFEEAFPVNSLPFLHRIVEILSENKTNSLKSLKGIELGKAKANLFILISHAYGQLFKIDSLEEFQKLQASVRPIHLIERHLT